MSDKDALRQAIDKALQTGGVDPEKFERHSALGDCRLVDAMLDVVKAGDL
jgi:hypothetical protein